MSGLSVWISLNQVGIFQNDNQNAHFDQSNCIEGEQ